MTHVPSMDTNASGVRLNQPPDKGAEFRVTVLFRSFRLKVSDFFFFFILLNTLRDTQMETVGAPPSRKYPGLNRTNHPINTPGLAPRTARHTPTNKILPFSGETAPTRSLVTGWLCVTLAEILKSSAGFNELPNKSSVSEIKSAASRQVDTGAICVNC